MKILALDSTALVASVALCEDETLLGEITLNNGNTHSETLLPTVEFLLARFSLTADDIDLFAVSSGPGSFTGVRIGVSAVKGMAHGANKPCIGVDALEALAMGVCTTDALLCPIQDARAGQVYGTAFLPGLPPVRQLPNMAEKLPVFIEKALDAADGRKLIFLGDGVKTYRKAIEDILGDRAQFAPAHMSYLRPASVAVLADLHKADAVDYLTLMPVYLRAPQAERERARKLGGNV